MHVDYHLVEHCNLNCRYCSHFSPLAEPSYLPVDVFEQDMQQLPELVGDDISTVHLLGGEPLLHPNIEHFVEIAFKCFP